MDQTLRPGKNLAPNEDDFKALDELYGKDKSSNVNENNDADKENDGNKVSGVKNGNNETNENGGIEEENDNSNNADGDNEENNNTGENVPTDLLLIPPIFCHKGILVISTTGTR